MLEALLKEELLEDIGLKPRTQKLEKNKTKIAGNKKIRPKRGVGKMIKEEKSI